MRSFEKSHKLDNVCYDIRGPVMDEANRMEANGIDILKLNIGNPAPHGLKAPDEIVLNMIHNLRESEGYSNSKGLFSARKAVMQYCQLKHIPNVGIDDIYTGNGVSELITMSMQGLLDNGDEVLVPMPDYPCGPPPSPSPAAPPCITAATRRSTGSRIWRTCAARSPRAPRASSSSTPTTPRAPSTPSIRCGASWRSPGSST
jgi:hypothetical protein